MKIKKKHGNISIESINIKMSSVMMSEKMIKKIINK